MSAEKKKVYVETSVVSNLTARPSPRLVEAARQVSTIEWWQRATADYELFSSFVVEREASRGDVEAARRRMEVLSGLRKVPFDDRAVVLAEALMDDTAVPRNSYDDALHIATAAVNGMDFLVTWNCRHIANAATRPIIRKTCERLGYACPEICTPTNCRRWMMEYKSVLDELWEIKDEIASQYASFAAYVEDMFRLQSEAHPEFARHGTTRGLAHA